MRTAPPAAGQGITQQWLLVSWACRWTAAARQGKVTLFPCIRAVHTSDNHGGHPLLWAAAAAVAPPPLPAHQVAAKEGIERLRLAVHLIKELLGCVAAEGHAMQCVWGPLRQMQLMAGPGLP